MPAAPTELTGYRLPRPIKLGAFAMIVVSHVFLLAHSQEPLRLNLGDPWSDANVLTAMRYVESDGFLATSFTDVLDVGPLTDESYRYTHYPPLAEIVYGAIHKYTGASSIGTFRLVAIAFSAIAMWMWFCYLRRLHGESVALIGTMLWSTNLLWLSYADSIHQAPIMHAAMFFALASLAKALDEPRRSHWVGAWIGSFAAFLASYDAWLFLPIGVVVTVGLRRGNPLARRNLRPVLLCASACVAAIVVKCAFVIGAVGWDEFVADAHFQFLERSTEQYEQYALIPMLVRRFTVAFSPAVWVVLGIQAVRLIVIARLPWREIPGAIARDATWMLFAAALFIALFSQLAASQMLASQVMLPFVTCALAMLVVRLLAAGGRIRQACAILIAVGVPLWSGYWMHRQSRVFLEPTDVASVNAYLAEHDHNDFVVSNLLADGPVQAYVHRHYWPAFYTDNDAQLHIHYTRLMAMSGRDELHVLMFKDPGSRVVDKALWNLASQDNLLGWPVVWQHKARRLIRAYDARLLHELAAIDAELVLSTATINVYRLNRDRILRAAERRVPPTAFADLGTWTSERNKLLGWAGARWEPAFMTGGAEVIGHRDCPVPGERSCRTVLTKLGPVFRGQRLVPVAELMLPGSSRCDADVIVRLLRPALITLGLNGSSGISAVDGTTYTARFSRSQVKDGINVIAIRFDVAPGATDDAIDAGPHPAVSSVELRPACEASPPPQ